MSKKNSKGAKPKTGLARCMELTSDRKGVIILAAVLSSLAAIASFIPYIGVYFMIRSIIGVFPDLGRLDMGRVMSYGWMALAGVLNKIMYISESFMQIDGNVAHMDEILNIPEMPETSKF